MVDFSNPEVQKLLAILSLLLLIPIGGYIQHRVLKKRKEIEDSYSYPTQKNSPEELTTSQQQIKQYILDYKDSYPKESIKQALVQAGNSSEEIENLLEKYY